jgi:predicted dehydrogenase
MFAHIHGIQESNCFRDWKELLDKPKIADAILLYTQDRMHFEPAIRALESGYFVLLEKPMSHNPLECIKLSKYAENYKNRLILCYVLRYTKFFSTI